MVSRREFLRGGAIASLVTAAPAMASRAMSASAPAAQAGYVALCDTRCAEGDAFLGALGGYPFNVQGIGIDPGAALPAIAAAVAAGRPILGLASDSVLTFAQQTAARDGYVLAFHGTHRQVDETTLEHTLTGDLQAITVVSDALAGQPQPWAEILARSASVILGFSGAVQGTKTRRVTAALPLTSRGHLVSFAMIPPAA